MCVFSLVHNLSPSVLLDSRISAISFPLRWHEGEVLERSAKRRREHRYWVLETTQKWLISKIYSSSGSVKKVMKEICQQETCCPKY